MSGRIGTAMQGAQAAFSPGLKHISAGWVDQELLTVRKMARDGATAEEIAAACGKSKAWAYGYIKRNNIVWNRIRGDLGRHVIASAGAMSAHVLRGHGKWVPEGRKLREQGLTIQEISRQIGVNAETISAYFARHGIKPLVPVTRKKIADRAGMLALIIRLHVEEVLSEGQVATATKLDRVTIRLLADELRAAKVAA